MMMKGEGQTVCTESAIGHPQLKVVIHRTVFVKSHPFIFKSDYDKNPRADETGREAGTNYRGPAVWKGPRALQNCIVLDF